MSVESYLLAAFAILLTGISKSGFAGGVGILGVPLVALSMPPQAAAVLLIPVLLAIDVLSVWRYRRAWQLRTVLVLLPGAIAGIGLGMAGFARIDPDLLRVAIGLMALAFVARFLFQDFLAVAPDTKAPWLMVFLASVVSGFAGFVAHAGGPPIKGIFLRIGLEKSAFVGTNAIFFLILNITKVLGYVGLGLVSSSSLLASASLAPFALMGAFIGFALHHRMSQLLFLRLTYCLLAFAGVNLLIIGLAPYFQ